MSGPDKKRVYPHWGLLLLFLTGCAADSLSPAAGMGYLIGVRNVQPSCDRSQPDDALRQRVANVLEQELRMRLQRAGAWDARSSMQLELCIDRLHLRPDLAVLLLYLFVDPDVLEVRARLLKQSRLQEEWHVQARNDAGGWPASLGKKRRIEILAQVVNRKILGRLKEATGP